MKNKQKKLTLRLSILPNNQILNSKIKKNIQKRKKYLSETELTCKLYDYGHKIEIISYKEKHKQKKNLKINFLC